MLDFIDSTWKGLSSLRRDGGEMGEKVQEVGGGDGVGTGFAT